MWIRQIVHGNWSSHGTRAIEVVAFVRAEKSESIFVLQSLRIAPLSIFECIWSENNKYLVQKNTTFEDALRILSKLIMIQRINNNLYNSFRYLKHALLRISRIYIRINRYMVCACVCVSLFSFYH